MTSIQHQPEHDPQGQGLATANFLEVTPYNEKLTSGDESFDDRASFNGSASEMDDVSPAKRATKTKKRKRKGKKRRTKKSGIKKQPSSARAKSAYASLSKQERREFRNAFRLFDREDDGQISIDALKEVFEGLNYHFSEAQLLAMIESIDDNGDGVIDINEFVLVMKGGASMDDLGLARTYLEEIKEAFEVFDKDGDGSISIHELAHIMEALGEKLTIKDIVDMMYEADNDGNGNIDFDEFQQLMREDHVMFQYNDNTSIGSRHIGHTNNRSRNNSGQSRGSRSLSQSQTSSRRTSITLQSSRMNSNSNHK